MSSNDFYNFVFTPTPLPPYFGHSQLLQNSEYVVCHVNDHPEELAAGVLSQAHSKSFPYLARCLVPAAFGYFASGEHLQIACRFYQHIVTQASDSVVTALLEPLLRSAATFRFLESVFTPFLAKLAIDHASIPRAGRKAYLPAYAPWLTRLILDFAALLPQGILDLFRVVLERPWPSDSFYGLFFRSFLWPGGSRWASGKFSADCAELFDKVTEIVGNQLDAISPIYSAFRSAKSIYSLPAIYDDPFLEYDLSVRDAKLLADLLRQFGQLPPNVALTELFSAPSQCDLNVFRARTYPHTRRPRASELPPLFEGGVLDQLLIVRLRRAQLATWLEELTCYEELLAGPVLRAAAHRGPGDFNAVFSCFQRFEPLIHLALLEARASHWLVEGMQVQLDLMDKEFAKATILAPGSEFDRFLEALPSSACRIVIDTVRHLALIDLVPWHERFRLLLFVMSQLKTVQKIVELPNTVFTITFHQSGGKNLLSTFIMLNLFAMKNPAFLARCSDGERQDWLRLESAILTVLRDDRSFINAYLVAQDALMAAFAKGLASEYKAHL
jgi:hypothetical protein